MDPGTMDDPDTVLVYDRTVSLWLPFDREDFEPRVFRRLRQAARSTVQTSAEDEAADDLLALTTVQNAPNVSAGSEEDRQVQALETSAEDEAADDVLALTTVQNAPNVPAGSEEDRQVQAQALELKTRRQMIYWHSRRCRMLPMCRPAAKKTDRSRRRLWRHQLKTA